MKLLFFSDIHANLPAFEAFLQKAEEIQPDAIYCLGDLVGYNVWANEVIDSIRKRRIPTIMGNHDEKQLQDLTGDTSNGGLTQKLLGEEQRRFLQQLPRHLSLEFGTGEKVFRMEMMHGSKKAINDYLLEDYPEADVLKMMAESNADLFLSGHTHLPYHRIIQEEEHYKHVINVGSAGKPKDRNTDGCCALLEFDQLDPKDPQSIKVSFPRFSYDVKKAMQGILDSDFPDKFAKALEKAR